MPTGAVPTRAPLLLTLALAGCTPAVPDVPVECGSPGLATCAYTALERGESVRLVGYGTSLTAGGAWLSQTETQLEAELAGDVVIVNAAQSAQWSSWGVDHLDERVITADPDIVFLEWAINDAFLDYMTSIEQARANWIDMIDRIRASHPDAEIVLMTMNVVTGDGAVQRPDILDYYAMVRDLADTEELPLVDAAPAWSEILARDPMTFATLVPDGVHPAPAGHCAITTPLVIAALSATSADPLALAEAVLTGAAPACP
jgi:acyl-CoA thioesterase-1